LAESRCGIKVSLAFGGNIGRAENKAMVEKLNIHLKQINRISFEKYDRFALVDSQPAAGNHSLPEDIRCHLVIDHHPVQKGTKADFSVVKPDIGVSATILIEWLQVSDLSIPANLATGLAYAISSETQNLGREATGRDIQAYLHVYVRSSIRKLAQISFPKLPRTYFITLAKALNRAATFRNLIQAHVGKVETPEIVAEIADFLVRHDRISWSICSGKFEKNLIISLRSTNPNANAGDIIKKLVSDPKTVGGHEMMAGGYIPLDGANQKELEEMENNLTKKFANLQGYEEPEWKSLFNSK
jgi:nanoRNase/pAp phosphatase (c-di-AMP/oligoRNAs hydrolase)